MLFVLIEKERKGERNKMETRDIDKILKEMRKEIMSLIEHSSETRGYSAYEMAYELVVGILKDISTNCKRTADEIVVNDMFKKTGAILSTGESQIAFLGNIFSDIETAKVVCGELISCMLRKLDKLERENRELKTKNAGNERAERNEENIPSAETEVGKSKEDEDEKETHYCFGTYNLNSLRCAANCCLNRMCKEETEARRKWNDWESGCDE